MLTVLLPQSKAAEQNLTVPHSLRGLVFTAKLDPNMSPPKLAENTPFESIAPCIHFTLVAGVNCHVLITQKCHPARPLLPTTAQTTAAQSQKQTVLVEER